MAGKVRLMPCVLCGRGFCQVRYGWKMAINSCGGTTSNWA